MAKDIKQMSIEELQALATEQSATIEKLNAAAKVSDDTIKELKSTNTTLVADLIAAQKENETIVKSMQVDGDVVELEFLKLKLKNGREVKFAQASHGDIFVDGMQYTPKGIMAMKPKERDELVSKLLEEHPSLFEEIFS